MMTDAPNIVFEDVFDLTDMDKDGKKFDRVSRVFASSQNYGMQLVLDVNTELYPMQKDDRFALALARTLNADGMASEHEGQFDAARIQTRSLADDYEYVMFGKVYKFDDQHKSANRVQALISYGGLLMSLEGDPRHMQDLDLGKSYYLLIRKA